MDIGRSVSRWSASTIRFNVDDLLENKINKVVYSNVSKSVWGPTFNSIGVISNLVDILPLMQLKQYGYR